MESLRVSADVPLRTAPLTRFRFGTFELDATSGELRSIENSDPSAKLILREQVFQLLKLLLEREGAIVTREEIKNRLWAGDTIVDFDRSINVTIKALRHALGDSADDPQYVETLARRGYRFMLPIERLESESALGKNQEQAQNTAAPRSENIPGLKRTMPRWREAALVLMFGVILVGVGYLSWKRFHAKPTPTSQKIMLAVLPFENLTGDPNKEYLADGLTEQTISVLGRLNPERLGVIARTSVMGYKHKDQRLDQIGRDLSVQYVLENSLRQSGDHVRLTSQLIQLKDQTHLWSKDYDYRAQDILAVQDDLAKAVSQEIQLRLNSQQQASLARSHSANPEAFDAYLQGHYFFQRNTDQDTTMAAKYYEKATQLDPSYALAWAGLSRVRKWQVMTGLIPATEGNRIAREAVQRALALDPNLAEAHMQLGRIEQQIDFDWAAADTSFQRAAALEPWNPEAAATAASSATMLGQFDRALHLSRRAVELDPLNPGSWSALAQTEYYLGKLSAGATDGKKSIELSPDVWPGPILLSRIFLAQGRPQEALSEIKLVRFDPTRAALYAIACSALGQERDSDAALKELVTKHYGTNPYQIAEVYAFRNQPDKAFEWLDRAYAQRNSGLVETKVDPFLKGLHNDPRYTSLLRKLKFPT